MTKTVRTAPYVIETMRNISNPTPDGRAKDRWNKAKWIDIGSRFVVYWSPDGYHDIRSMGGYGSEPSVSALGKEIMRAGNSTQVEPKTIREIKAVTDCEVDGDDYLRALLKMGRITVDDIKAAGKAINAEYDAAESA